MQRRSELFLGFCTNEFLSLTPELSVSDKHTHADYLLNFFTHNEMPHGTCVDAGREKQRQEEAKVDCTILLSVSRSILLRKTKLRVLSVLG